MTPEPVEALVERVRDGFSEAEALSIPADEALTELAERVKAAEEALERGAELTLKLHKNFSVVEAQRDELVEALERFMEWDALTALPDPLPAPFADLPYWLTVFRAALASVRSDDMTGIVQEGC